MNKITRFKIERKKLNYLYTNLSSAMLGALSISLIFYFATKDHVDNQLLNYWIIANIIILFVRIILLKIYNKTNITTKNIKKFYKLFFIFMFLAALLWTVIPFTLFPKELELQVLTLLLVGGLATGGHPLVLLLNHICFILFYFYHLPHYYLLFILRKIM